MTRRGRALRRWLCALAACACLGDAPAADAPSEYQIKAVFTDLLTLGGHHVIKAGVNFKFSAWH